MMYCARNRAKNQRERGESSGARERATPGALRMRVPTLTDDSNVERLHLLQVF